MKGTVRERLYARLIPDPDTGCLLWTGRCTPRGYGLMRAGGQQIYVHRLAWELENGPIPDGLEIDHVQARGCRHRNCANVAHLEPVTHYENVMRGNGLMARYARQTHCLRGHPFDETNTYKPPAGGRVCRICRRASRQTWRARQKEAASPLKT